MATIAPGAILLIALLSCQEPSSSDQHTSFKHIGSFPLGNRGVPVLWSGSPDAPELLAAGVRHREDPTQILSAAKLTGEVVWAQEVGKGVACSFAWLAGSPQPLVVAGVLGPEHPAPPVGSILLLDGTTGSLVHTINPLNPNCQNFGHCLAAVGDLDGDTIPEIAASSLKGGDLCIDFIAVGPPPRTIRTLSWPAEGARRVDSLAHSGDYLLVGVSNYAAGGKPTGFLSLFNLSGEIVRQHFGQSAGFGISATWIGDWDDDGVSDYAASNPAWSDTGRVMAYSGKTGDLIASWQGREKGDNFGMSLAAFNTRGSQRLELLAGCPRFYRLSSGSLFELSANGTKTEWAPGSIEHRVGFGASVGALPYSVDSDYIIVGADTFADLDADSSFLHVLRRQW